MIEHKYATFWPRFVASLIDALIFIPIEKLISLIYRNVDSVPVLVGLYVINASMYLVYSIWMHGKFGQTVGKLFCRVTVLDVSEGPLRMRQAFLRDIFFVIVLPIDLALNLPTIINGHGFLRSDDLDFVRVVVTNAAFIWGVLELITMLTNDKRRALHDFIAATVVI